MIRQGPSELAQFFTNTVRAIQKYDKPVADAAQHIESLQRTFAELGGKNQEGQFHLPPTDTAPLAPGMELRKAYVSPSLADAPQFLRELVSIVKQKNVRWLDAKENTIEAVKSDSKGNAIAQEHNVLCFYFRNDGEFGKFTEAVAQAEIQSGAKLLRFPKKDMAMYGQELDGAINFGLDLPGGGNGTNFDAWKTGIVMAAIKAKNAGASPEGIRQAMDADMRSRRGVGLEDFLTLKQDVPKI